MRLAMARASLRPGSGDMLELLIDQLMFIGFKADRSLRLRLESLTIPEMSYFSSDDSGFLRVCRLGEDTYVGKLIRDRLTTNQVDDIRRNILSIVRKLEPLIRLPGDLKILACNESGVDSPRTAEELTLPPTVKTKTVSSPAPL
jgi:hypothetical protein